MKNIIFIAPPAAGKGTASDTLCQKYGYVHISTGDILREMAKDNSELGQNIKQLLQKGELIPDDVVYEALTKRLLKDDVKNGYILDGFPRNLEQAIKYDEIIKNINGDMGIVINLDTNKSVLEKRITGRRICKDCGQTHNVLTGVNPPVILNKCNKCGGELYQRDDDNFDSFQNRYQTYLNKTLPLLDYYQKKNVLNIIKSEEPDDTIKEIEALIND